MKTIPIAQANQKQLYEHATLVLGLDVKPGTRPDHILAKIRTVKPDIAEVMAGDELALPIQPAAPAPAHNVGALAAAEAARQSGGVEPGPGHHDDPRVHITIPETLDAGGDRDVAVSVNGFQWLIRRNVETPVPYRVFEALQIAWQDLYEQKKPDSPTDRPETIKRTVLSYPFNVNMAKMPSAEAIAAYHARTAGVFAP
jgi:hypothetical protein